MAGERTTIGDSERWLSVIVGGMLALSSVRGRDFGSGLLFATGGAALIFRGIVGHDGLLDALGAHFEAPPRSGNPSAADEVEQAGMESFPASDPPSFTPSSGTDVGSAPEAEEGDGGEDA